MFSIDQPIGDVVYVKFNDPSFLTELGIDQRQSHFLVKGQDNFGLWLEHPRLEFLKSENSEGKPLPPNKQSVMKVDATFLVQWHNISTVMHYPNREGYDFPSEFDKDVGFKVAKTQEND